MATPNNQHYDVLVVGAGVAGGAIATAFGRQGRTVLLIERCLAAPDRIVGELLQPGGVEALQQLGLSHCLEEIDAIPVKGYHIYWKDLQSTFWFTSGYSKSAHTRDISTPNPEGRSFHHGAFISKLREAAAAENRVTVLETTARELIRDESSGNVIGVGCSHGDKSSTIFLAHLVILADGCNSNFRVQFTHHRPSSVSRFWGLELTDAPLQLPGYAHGVLGSGPPLLLYQIGERTTRILVDIPHKTYDKLGSVAGVRAYIHDRVLPTVPENIQPSLRKAIESGRLRSMANSWMPATRNRQAGLIVLGDSSNMRHPVTGAGMTVALKDVALLATLLHPKNVPSFADSERVLSVLGSFHWKRKRYCASLNILAQALYLLFASEGIEIMQRGFIRFIQGGEANFAVPVGLMGGLIENPFLLFYYFFGIAIYSMGLHIRQSTIVGLPCALTWSIGILFML